MVSFWVCYDLFILGKLAQKVHITCGFGLLNSTRKQNMLRSNDKQYFHSLCCFINGTRHENVTKKQIFR